MLRDMRLWLTFCLMYRGRAPYSLEGPQGPGSGRGWLIGAPAVADLFLCGRLLEHEEGTEEKDSREPIGGLTKCRMVGGGGDSKLEIRANLGNMK